MNAAAPFTEAVAIKDERILNIGSADEIKAPHSDASTEIIDMSSRTLMPGFIDSHRHLFLYGNRVDYRQHGPSIRRVHRQH